MPNLIGIHHNDFVKHFLVNGKLDWSDRARESFGQTKEGYLLPIELIVKVHPEISGQLKILGVLRTLEQTDRASAL